MKVEKVMVQIGLPGTDLITLITDLETGIYPFADTGGTFRTDIVKGSGVDYAIKNFEGSSIEVLDHKEEFPKWEKIK